MRIPVAACAAAVISCSACVQFEPRPLDPEAEYVDIAERGGPLPEAPPSNLPASALFPLAADVSAADGLDLAETNALALFFAPELLESRSRHRLHGAELLRAGRLVNPELFFGPRLATDGSGNVFPASLSIEVPLGGRLDAEEDRARAELEAARCLLLEAEARVLVAVRRTFIELAALDRREQLLAGLVGEADGAVDRMRRRVEGGEDDGVSLAVTVLERDELRRELRATGLEAAEKGLRLAAAVGLLPGEGIRFHAEADLLDAATPRPRDRERLLAHPLLRSLAAAYAAAEHGLEVEIARQYPVLAIGPEFESSGGSKTIGLGFTISLPVFDHNEGGIAVAEAQRVAGREAWQAALLELSEREGRARARHDRSRSELLELRQKTIPAAEAAERALEARLGTGQSSLIEVLAVRRSIAEVRLREVDLLREVALEALDLSWYAGQLFCVDEKIGVER